MTRKKQPPFVEVRVPATTTNLGPGFDTLGLALDLWNTVRFTLEGSGVNLTIRGEGSGALPEGEENLIWQAFTRLYAEAGAAPPSGVRITCKNGIHPGSGLGSSAAAVVSGLLGANALLGMRFPLQSVFSLAARLEGHPDNAAAALFGGLVIVGGEQVRRVAIPPWTVVYVLPAVRFSTRQARAALPAQVSLEAAAGSIGRALLVVEALRSGDLPLLREAMQDVLHQPYRLPHLPGMEAALEAARNLGGAAALSGAGPGMVVFCRRGQSRAIAEAVQAAFRAAGVESRAWTLRDSAQGAIVA